MIAPKTLRAAEAHLSKVDPLMARLIDRHGPVQLGGKARTPFHVLCSSIIGQQLSTKAADTIQGRVAALLAAPADAFEPMHFATVSHESLRSCGLSSAKARWLLDLAERARDGRFDARALAGLPDAELTAALDELPGIGLWTAEMMLIFAFDRLDIFSLGDASLRRAINTLYGRLTSKGTPRKLTDRQTLKITARWIPYRSVACWYLWQQMDNAPD